MQTTVFQKSKFCKSAFLILVSLFVISFESCEKAVGTSQDEALTASDEAGLRRRPPKPPPPQPFAFICSNPVINGNFVAGVPTTATITMSYVNSPGGPHQGFTSTTVNGITLKALPGTLTVGSGTIVYKASGTPVSTGFFNITVSISTSIPCMLVVSALNPPVSGPTADPSPVVGSTGIVNFIYKGQAVAYKTVRAADNRIWLQQNLGSPQVAFHTQDQASYGDYFQWGRWDDGHQAPNSATITGGPSLLNPSHSPSGNPKFIKGTTAGTKWWGTGGLATDTWSGNVATSTKGKDPCAALGAGWRLPTAAEWENVSFLEDLFGTMAAFDSNLKLPAAGYRLSYDGMVFRNGDNGHYWTNKAENNSYARVFVYDDNTYDATTALSNRAEGFSCRCIKN